MTAPAADPTPETFAITLAFEDDKHAPDSAAANTLRAEVVGALRAEGHTAEAQAAGQRGNPLVLLLLETGRQVWENKDTAIEVVVAIAAPVIERYFEKWREQEAEEEADSGAPPRPIEVCITIDGATICVTADDERTAARLAERFLTQHRQVAAQATPQSNVKVAARLPRRRR